MQPVTQISYQETIPLHPEEKLRLATRTGWEKWLGDCPIPCLFVTARVDLSITRKDNLAIETLRQTLSVSRSRDSMANAYREFLQKILTKLNWKVLRSHDPTYCFHFRGVLERDLNDAAGKNLHYHFCLWAPDNKFKEGPALLAMTKEWLTALWHARVNSIHTARYMPIQIDLVTGKDDAKRIASYENKANPLTSAYELFDDWSTSRKLDLLQ